MLAGNYLIDGRPMELGTTPPWDLDAPTLAADLHGFAWLDDVAAVDNDASRATAQDWVFDWIDRYDTGQGPGWRADLTGRRVIRWIHHAILILHRRSPDDSRRYFRSLARQSRFLSRRWRSVPAGLPRFEALAGLVYAGLALDGLSHLLDPALRALARECAREIADDGALPERDPEAMAEVLTLLAWVNLAVSSTGQPMHNDIINALDRLAPALRAVRMGDGHLARFHGSAGGRPDRIDQALSDAMIRTPANPEGAMGYTRLAAGGTVVVADTAPLPTAPKSDRAHASSLAFELSEGRIPIITNMGAARKFGPEMRQKARQTASHSTLVVDDVSSARFITDGIIGATFGQRLGSAPRNVGVSRETTPEGLRARTWHDGYRKSHGLTHERTLLLLHTGGKLVGLDRVRCMSAKDKERLSHRMERSADRTLDLKIYFNAHPDVDVSIGMRDTVAAFRTITGSTWLLRVNDGHLSLADTVYVDETRLQPRATKQVVVSWPINDYDDAVTWTLSRAD